MTTWIPPSGTRIIDVFDTVFPITSQTVTLIDDQTLNDRIVSYSFESNPELLPQFTVTFTDTSLNVFVPDWEGAFISDGIKALLNDNTYKIYDDFDDLPSPNIAKEIIYFKADKNTEKIWTLKVNSLFSSSFYYIRVLHNYTPDRDRLKDEVNARTP